MTQTSTRPKNHRQRGKYARPETQPEPAGHRTRPSDFPAAPNDRPEGPTTHKVRITRGHGFYGGSHRICYSQETGGSLKIGTKDYTEINQIEFEKLQNETIRSTFYDGEKRVVRHLRRFEFLTIDGEPVSLPEIPDETVVAVA